MNALKSLRRRTRIGLLLGILLLSLLANNILGQDSYVAIREDARAIYEDRLMPSTFIFDLQEQLYAQQALLRQPASAARDQGLGRLRARIADLVAKYEKTRLTRDERREWNGFRGHLAQLHSGVSGSAFGDALQSLTRLNAIQAGVAKDLESRLTAAASASEVRGYLELGLLVVVAAATLALAGYSRTAFQEPVSHRPSLN